MPDLAQYAKDRRISYYGVRLGPNSIETEEGYRVYKDCVIGRTGTQAYKFSELPPADCEAIGLSAGPDDMVDLYRDPAEVFSTETLSSFEGKSVTDGHPERLITINDVDQHELGHIQNIRAGTEVLDDGNLPMLADVYIKSKRLLAKIDAGLRELSCGYTYHIIREGNLILQVEILGNHLAVVDSGRAGNAALMDQAPAKERTVDPVTHTKPAGQKWGAFFAALGLSMFAKDAKPEVLADAMSEMAKDSVPEDKGKEGANDAAAKDAARAADRKKYHDALDAMMNEREEREGAADTEMAELRKDMAAMFGGDSAPEHAAGCDSEECAGDCMGGDSDPDDDEDDDEEEAGTDEATSGGASPEVLPEDERSTAPAGTDRRPGRDRAPARRPAGRGRDADVAALKLLRPFIARSKDAKVRAAFDTIATGLNRTVVRRGGSGYGDFGRAAARTGHDQAPEGSAAAEASKLNAAYATEHRKIGPGQGK